MFSIIEKQQSDKNIPLYLDARIQNIPVKDTDEELVDIHKMKNKRIRMLPTPEIPLSSPETNAGFECSSFVRKSLYERLEAMIANIDILTSNTRNISILVYEGLRTLEVQNKLFETTMCELKEQYSDLSNTELHNLTSKYVCHPTNSPPHASGGAVDIRLYDDSNMEFIDMGDFGFWNNNKQTHTFSVNLTETQKSNRHLLLSAASISGLVNYPYEWWHFSYGDKYFCYYTGNPVSIYKDI